MFKDPYLWEDVVIAIIVVLVILLGFRFLAPPGLRDLFALNPSPGITSAVK